MNRPFIVAEISANHLGSLERAKTLVNVAAMSGADAVKFQTFTPEQMVDEDHIIEAGPWAGMPALDLYRQACTPREWHPDLFALARFQGLVPFSSVFHPDDVEFLEALDCPIYKIASFEITDYALIERAARTRRPMLISTGMASEAEIRSALTVAHEAGCPAITLLKCSSAYPAPPDQANLATMGHLLSLPWCESVGFSDHTLGSTCAIAATAMGAQVIEKHLTIDRNDGGPDATFSAEPGDFADLVNACRLTAQAIGSVSFGPTPAEMPQTLLRRKSGQKRGFK